MERFRRRPHPLIILERRQAGLVLEEPADVGLEEERGHAAARGLGKVVALSEIAVEVAQPARLGIRRIERRGLLADERIIRRERCENASMQPDRDSDLGQIARNRPR